MTKTWWISDTHFGHENAVSKFKRPDGSPLRDFANAEEMDEYMIARWNERVQSNERVYHCGDVVINRKFLSQLERLNGRIVLVKGNHDIYDLNDYRKYFDDIRSYVVSPKGGYIASHVPLHESCIDRFGLNIHGHLHYNIINDPRYINISVEQIQYAPISTDQLMKRAEENKIHFSETGSVINFADRATR